MLDSRDQVVDKIRHYRDPNSSNELANALIAIAAGLLYIGDALQPVKMTIKKTNLEEELKEGEHAS
jgi:hypothetical protein